MNKKEDIFVKCDSCKKDYESVFGDDFQGINCASDVVFKNNSIFSSYGSDFDGNVYSFINGEIPDFVENGLICDDCIKKLLKNNNLKLEAEERYF